MNNQYPDLSTPIVTPGLLRRLAAMLYDGLLLLALIMVVTAILTLPLGMPTGYRLTALQFLLFEIVPLIFFCGFWVYGGQTLGMRSWRLKLLRADGTPVGWRDALKRHFAALLSWLAFGLGFFWILLDRDALAWHDRLSDTRLTLQER
jgi:uncharacterized RDD family membrane protein YckC